MTIQVNELKDLLIEVIHILIDENIANIEEDGKRIEDIEQQIDDLTAEYRQMQIDRLVDKNIDANVCVTFSQMMTDIERISDHLLNIMEEYRNVHISLTQQVFAASDSAQ